MLRPRVNLSILVLLLTTSHATAQPAPAAPSPDGPASQPASPSGSELGELRRRLDEQGKLIKQQQQELSEHKETLKSVVDELAEERATKVNEQTKQEETKTFSAYGFFDLNFQKIWISDSTLGAATFDRDPQFVFGNLNLYFDWRPLSSWRMLTEIRFLLNPIGDVASLEVPMAGLKFQRVDTETQDAAAFQERFDYGAIEIERAQLEWTPREWLSFTFGLFLTPYGIWNVDHGSPTRTMAMAPLLYAYRFFPERQLGIMAHGSVPIRSLTLGYALTLSNGRGPANTLKDSDFDKAIGGRVELSGLGRVRWKAGVSVYGGRFTDYKLKALVNPNPPEGGSGITMERETTVQYYEAALSADLDVSADPFDFQAEFFCNWRKFSDDHRPAVGYYARIFVPEQVSFGTGLEPNTFSSGASFLARYRLPFKSIALRPYFSIMWLNMTDNRAEDNSLHIFAGLNWRIQSAVVVKAEYHMSHYPNKSPMNSLVLGAEDTHYLATQLAVAF